MKFLKNRMTYVQHSIVQQMCTYTFTILLKSKDFTYTYLTMVFFKKLIYRISKLSNEVLYIFHFIELTRNVIYITHHACSMRKARSTNFCTL